MNDNLPGDTVVTYASRSDMYRFLSQPAMMTYGYDILYQKVYQRLYMNTTAIHYKIIVIIIPLVLQSIRSLFLPFFSIYYI
jgi:hypothetical protein